MHNFQLHEQVILNDASTNFKDLLCTVSDTTSGADEYVICHYVESKRNLLGMIYTKDKWVVTHHSKLKKQVLN